MERVGAVLARAVARIPRRGLAPLEPDAFLRWVYDTSPECHVPGSSALTVEDIWWEWSRRHLVNRLSKSNSSAAPRRKLIRNAAGRSSQKLRPTLEVSVKARYAPSM